MSSLKRWAKALKQNALVVYLVGRDPRTPWLVRLLAVLVAAYAFSPIDLIPDFIPILGYLDDLILVPLGIALIIHLTPPEIIADARQKAAKIASRPTSRGAMLFIAGLWLIAALALCAWLFG